MAPKVERITEIEPVELGEGPHWDTETGNLYFVDIFGKSIHKYVPATKKHTKAVIGKKLLILILNMRTILLSICTIFVERIRSQKLDK